MKYRFNSQKHSHSLDDKPLFGTSTIMGVVAKPLTWWASGLACEKLGWTNSKIKVNGKYQNIPLESRKSHVEPFLEEIKGMTTVQFLDRLDEAYKAHSAKLDSSAKTGTDMHAELEKYVKKCLENNGTPFAYEGDFVPVQIFSKWALEKVNKFLYSEVYCYSETLWVGGISDCGFEDKDGNYGIIDFKSSKEAYVTQFMQIAGYDMQLSENGGFDENGNQILKLDKPIMYYCVLPFGMENPEVVYNFDTKMMKEGFNGALTLHKIITSNETK